MNGLSLIWCMLANVDAFRAASRYIREGRGDGTEQWIMITTAAMIVLFWTALFAIEKLRRGPSPLRRKARSLFDELCKAHELTSGESQLLASAARGGGLEEPAEIFLRPTIVRKAAIAEPEHHGLFNQLGERLFGHHWAEYRIALEDPAEVPLDSPVDAPVEAPA